MSWDATSCPKSSVLHGVSLQETHLLWHETVCIITSHKLWFSTSLGKLPQAPPPPNNCDTQITTVNCSYMFRPPKLPLVAQHLSIGQSIPQSPHNDAEYALPTWRCSTHHPDNTIFLSFGTLQLQCSSTPKLPHTSRWLISHYVTSLIFCHPMVIHISRAHCQCMKWLLGNYALHYHTLITAHDGFYMPDQDISDCVYFHQLLC